MPAAFSGNLIFAIIARLLWGNPLNFVSLWDGTLYLVIVLSVSSVRSEKRGPVAGSSAAEAAALTCDSRDS